MAALDEQRTAIAAFFAIPLTRREGAGVLRDRAGGFYRCHRDVGVDDALDAERAAVAWQIARATAPVDALMRG